MFGSRRWRVYAQHECLFLIGPQYGGDYIVAAMNLETCPKCGEPCGLNHRDEWARVVRRWVSDATWFEPWTWGRGHWEYRERGHLEAGGFDYRKTMRNARRATGDGRAQPASSPSRHAPPHSGQSVQPSSSAGSPSSA